MATLLLSRRAFIRFSLASTSSRAVTAAAAASEQYPPMPPCDFKPDPYTGRSYDETMALRKKYLTPALVTYHKKPVLIHQGHQQWLFDETGKRYLDLFAGIVTVSVGHCHPKVTEAAKKQLDKLWHTTNIYMHPNIHEFGEKLASKLPGDLKVVYFTNSGSEANDLAVTMAKLHTGAHDIINLRNSYHGGSPFAMEMTNLGNWKFPLHRNLGIHATVNPDVYRGPWGGANCRSSVAQTQRSCSCAEGQCQATSLYLDQLDDLLRHCTPGKIAGFFAEAIQGVGGAVQLPKGYLKGAYDLIRAKGGVCISDEVYNDRKSRSYSLL